MKRLFFLSIPSVADTSISDNEVTSSGDNASATAGIMITMTGVVDQ